MNLSEVSNYLLDLLPRAGQILRRYFHAETLTKKMKGKLDFVTAADLAVDKFIHDKLSHDYPKIPIFSEETAPKDFSGFKGSDYLWVVDPLDGTANFSRGDANFSISIALVRNSKSLVGAIFLPVSSRMFWAQKDREGAYWNGRRIYISQTSKLRDAVVCTDWSHILGTRELTTQFLSKIYYQVCQFKILGSAATDMTLLARGGVDIYHHVHLMPWDIAAAALIVEKAGGKITDSYGNSWDVFTPGILAANPQLHQKLLKVINH
ncbi:hypothetical protein A2960_02550 [Candidatus Gottesmanbacteria bacterium RIFCSPLOWO2_01_FULL_39_12b]|uniref:Inositol-1-monophosphatase n=1 Tax=Candidatus Gottesmanbacteria bacterium RIFCSPLOWO2_01_FULL_39_12b TaxID=1798388 RepID=A0A1F6AR64_9BACT|nr:MAG: hypothetical protein A2960_02550 [Candidatus Gottesmanbacteria bacterium RIFCSPLOWO2_01_FULL_39_12b]